MLVYQRVNFNFEWTILQLLTAISSYEPEEIMDEEDDLLPTWEGVKKGGALWNRQFQAWEGKLQQVNSGDLEICFHDFYQLMPDHRIVRKPLRLQSWTMSYAFAVQSCRNPGVWDRLLLFLRSGMCIFSQGASLAL